jgi:hypothetical protein
MTTTNCGDTCGLIDFTMAVAGDRLLPEERMKLAIEAVTSGKMSQRAAAAKYGVVRGSLQNQLKEVAKIGHPAETQSTTEVSPDPVPAPQPEKLKSSEVRSRLRALLRQHNAPKGIGGKDGISSSQARGWLHSAGIPIPPELNGAATPFDLSATTTTPTPAQTDDANKQGIPANDPLPVFPDRPTETDPEDDAILDERIDLNKLSQQVLSDVISSARSDSFKRAATLATELEQLLCLAFYGKDDWSGQDWVHINGQLKTCKSLAGQRAEEAHREVFHERYPKGGAVAV